VKVLAMAAAEPAFADNEKAAELLAKRCSDDLSPMVDAIASLRSDAIRGRLLKLLRANLNAKTTPGVLRAARVKLRDAEPGGAGGLLQAIAAVGNDEAWKLFSQILADRQHPRRDIAVDALRRWPNEHPLSTLETILADKARESENTRASALRAALPMLERRASRTPVRERAALFEAKLQVARELGMEEELLAALGRTGSLQAMKTLGSYVNHGSLSEQAVEAIEVCAQKLGRNDLLAAAARLGDLAAKTSDPEDRGTLTDTAARLRQKHATTAPGLGDVMEEADELDLDL
jgi:hypothetical protein